MNFMPTKKEKARITTTLLIGMILTGVMGVVALINHIANFQATINQYTEQGYPKEMVMEALFSAQFLPRIWDILGLFGGGTLLILGIFFLVKTLGVKEEPDEDPEEKEEPLLEETTPFEDSVI
jgi:hypothetical protein